MYAFTYHRASGLRQASNMLGKLEDPKLLAGGQTLLPTMKQRLASPANIIDLGADRRNVRHRAEGPFAGDRRDDAARRCRELAGRAGEHSGARLSCRPDRRSGGASPRHDRRLDRQQRSERGLSGRLRLASARPSSPSSARSRRTSSSRACSKPRSRPTRSSPRSAFRSRRRPATTSSATRPRASRWSACSSPSGRRKSASPSPAPAAPACSA